MPKKNVHYTVTLGKEQENYLFYIFDMSVIIPINAIVFDILLFILNWLHILNSDLSFKKKVWPCKSCVYPKVQVNSNR